MNLENSVLSDISQVKKTHGNNSTFIRLSLTLLEAKDGMVVANMFYVKGNIVGIFFGPQTG